MRRGGGQYLTLALHCCVLQRDLRIREIGEREGDQSELFRFMPEQRESFARFARTLRHYTKAQAGSRASVAEFLKDLDGLDLQGHEFYGFFGQVGDESILEAAADLDRAAGGEAIDYAGTSGGVGDINARALWAHENERGGCF